MLALLTRRWLAGNAYVISKEDWEERGAAPLLLLPVDWSWFMRSVQRVLTSLFERNVLKHKGSPGNESLFLKVELINFKYQSAHKEEQLDLLSTNQAEHNFNETDSGIKNQRKVIV